jgi:hypothetical protein
LVVECRRRPEIGYFDPLSITFESCPEWQPTENGYLLKGMRVLILGMDGYLGWPLALKLARLGCRVIGIDNMLRRRLVDERGAQSVSGLRRQSGIWAWISSFTKWICWIVLRCFD